MRGIGLVASLLLGATAAQAQDAPVVSDFYKSHPITLIVSSGAGGGYDTYSRLLSRFLPAHVPGAPHVIVKNMPGAGSRVASNYVANVAPRDGSVISDADSTMPFSGLLQDENARFDPLKLNWLGSISKQVSICVAWAAGSFKSIDDLMSRPMHVSGTGVAGWRITLPRIYDAVSGAKLVTVPGYSTTEALLAVERGEVDGTCPTYDTLLATKPDWLIDHKVRLLAQFGLGPTPGLEEVPAALDRVGGATDRAALEVLLSQQVTGRPYFVHPDVPAARVAALRAAFDATMTDADFLGEAKRMRLWIDPLSATRMETLLRNAYATPQPIIERARSLLAQASTN